MTLVLSAPQAAAAPGVPPHFTAISVSAAVVCLVVAQLLRWKPLARVEFLVPWLCLIAGIGFSAAFLRGWVSQLAGMGKSLPVIGVAVTVSIAIFLAFVVIYDMWPKHRSTNMTSISALLLPAFAPEIGGAIGALLSSVLGAIAVAGATAISTLLGVN